MTFEIPSPFVIAPPPLKGEVLLAEASVADVLERAAERLAGREVAAGGRR